MIEPWLWVLVAYLIGALPFSVWLGRLALRVDIRAYGDHNPGASNVFRAGGWGWGALALALDVGKGALAIGLAWVLGGQSWAGQSLAFVALGLAPALGHAWSPFLGFRGGKAVAVTFGIWAALSLGGAALLWAVALVLAYFLLDVDGWAVMLSFGAVLVYVLAAELGPLYLGIWTGHAALLAWRQRQDLARRPHIRPRWPRAAGP